MWVKLAQLEIIEASLHISGHDVHTHSSTFRLFSCKNLDNAFHVGRRRKSIFLDPMESTDPRGR